MGFYGYNYIDSAGKINNMSKKNKLPARKKIDLELLNQRLGHRSTRLLLAVDNANVWDILLAPDLCDRLFSIITLMYSGHTCLFQKGFCTVYFGADKINAVTLPHAAQRKHTFTGKIKNMSKKNKFPARKKLALELLHQTLAVSPANNDLVYLCPNI